MRSLQFYCFILDYSNHGYKLSVKQKIGEMVTNGSGIRDTARVLNKACFDRNVRTKKAVRGDGETFLV